MPVAGLLRHGVLQGVAFEAGGGAHHERELADSPTLEAIRAVIVVVHFVVRNDVGRAGRVHLLDRVADPPPRQVDIMAELLAEHPAACFAGDAPEIVASPGARVIRALCIQHASQQAAVDPIFHCGVEVRVAQLETNLQKALGTFSGFHHRRRVFQRGGHRLLAHHGFAGFKGCNRQLSMHVV